MRAWNLLSLLAAAQFCSNSAAQDWKILSSLGRFYHFSQGHGPAIRSGTTENTMLGMDFAGDGCLYGIGTSPEALYRLDPVTGEETHIGQGLYPPEGDVAYDPTTDSFFLVRTALHSIDLETGEATIIGFHNQSDDISGLGIDAEGRMWALDTNISGNGIVELLEIDKSDGRVLSRRSTGFSDAGAVIGADFDSSTNEFFMAASDGQLYRVDTATAELDQIDSHLVEAVYALAYVAPSPCQPDWNDDGVVDSNDFFSFVDGYISGVADYNDDGDVNSDDFFGFIAGFMQGCDP